MVATYKDIRRLTGLSLATISKYYNGGNVLETNRALIEKAASELGFQINHVARGLRSRRTMTIGIVLDQLRSTFTTTVVSRVEERLREAGYGAIICDARGDDRAQAEAVQFLVSKMVDGIVVIPVGDDATFLAPARDRGVPVVAVDRLISGVDSVVIDNRRAIASAVDLLVDAGHTRVGLVAGPDSTYTMRERRTGFRQSIHARTGGFPSPELLAPQPVSIEGGHAGLLRLVGLEEPPTAIVCANYEYTLGATIALRELSTSAPRVALVGFDNLELARLLTPPPSLVVQPVDQLAVAAAELLLDRLGRTRPPEPTTVTLDTMLLAGDEATYRRE